ncbi:MAG TPA: patatin-like phospholipase family protein [Rhodanobacteraceae bacterium]
MSFKLLCCDGGGIRGLMTALLIENLDRDFGVIGTADGFAGTSTGGLIALALANKVPINRIIQVYEYEGENIFKPNDWLLDEAAKAPNGSPGQPQGLESGPGYFFCQYTNTGLIDIAHRLLGKKRLSDMTKYVAVNSARLWDGASWQAATLSNAPDNDYRDVMLRDAALATSAAPTYFPPCAIEGLGYFADGGTFANNPVMAALADAFGGGCCDTLGNVRALSLGTGVVPQGIPPGKIDNPLDWGATWWMDPWASRPVPAMPLLNLMMDATAQVAAGEARHLLGDGFCRGNVPLHSNIPLDGWRQVGELRAAAETYMQSDAWRMVRGWVRSHWV